MYRLQRNGLAVYRCAQFAHVQTHLDHCIEECTVVGDHNQGGVLEAGQVSLQPHDGLQ